MQVIEETLDRLFDLAPLFGEPAARYWRRITWATRDRLAGPEMGEELCASTARASAEGDDCDAVLLRKAYKAVGNGSPSIACAGSGSTEWGWARPTDGVRIDLYARMATTPPAAWTA